MKLLIIAIISMLTLTSCVTTPIRQCRNVCFSTLSALDDLNNPSNIDVKSRQAYLITFDPWKYGVHSAQGKGGKHVVVKITMKNGLVSSRAGFKG